jgi:hypothetical protein
MKVLALLSIFLALPLTAQTVVTPSLGTPITLTGFLQKGELQEKPIITCNALNFMFVKCALMDNVTLDDVAFSIAYTANTVANTVKSAQTQLEDREKQAESHRKAVENLRKAFPHIIEVASSCEKRHWPSTDNNCVKVALVFASGYVQDHSDYFGIDVLAEQKENGR